MKKNWLLSAHESKGFLHSKMISQVAAKPYIHHTEELYFNVPSAYGLVNITERLEECLKRSGVRDGLCFVSAMHITAGVYVNDAESGLLQDIATWIETLAPRNPSYLHHQTGEDNGDAHLKSFLTNHQLSVPITEGRLHLGTWQQIFYAEYDGRREKRVLVKITGLSS